jgi:hypothetical protein
MYYLSANQCGVVDGAMREPRYIYIIEGTSEESRILYVVAE